MCRQLDTLLGHLLDTEDRREFEDSLALVSDDIYLTTRQVGRQKTHTGGKARKATLVYCHAY